MRTARAEVGRDPLLRGALGQGTEGGETITGTDLGEALPVVSRDDVCSQLDAASGGAVVEVLLEASPAAGHHVPPGSLVRTVRTPDGLLVQPVEDP